MIFAAVHLPLYATLPAASAAALALAWYWQRLGQSQIPNSRRRIRRLSLAIMIVSLPVAVGALSVIDPTPSSSTAEAAAAARQQYAAAWTIIMLMLLSVIVTAVIDVLNSLRLLQNQRREEFTRTATDLAIAIHKRRRTDAEHRDERPAQASDPGAST